jgi:hypothetical protein
MFNLYRLVPKYSVIKTINVSNKNKMLYQQVNKKVRYNKILKRNFASFASAGTGGGGGGSGGGGGGGNNYWQLAAIATSVYIITNIGKPPPPPFTHNNWFPLNKKYT